LTMPAGWLWPNGAHGRRAKQILRADAFEYHRKARPGKIAIAVTKPCATQRDLSLAYAPGIACLQ